MASIKTVNDTTFAKTVLASRMPMLVIFGSRACSASRVLGELLVHIVQRTGAMIGLAQIDIDRSHMLAESYGVGATPTLLLFCDGDVATRIVGFVPPGLLEVLISDVSQGQIRHEQYWRPLETVVEDSVILPLVQQAGLHYQRQVGCTMIEGGTRRRGRIDVLVSDAPDGPPCTLIESKRLLRDRRDLHQAAIQALGYARALALPSFIVAAPSGMWLFRPDDTRPILEQTLSSLEIHRTPDLVVRTFQRLKRHADTMM